MPAAALAAAVVADPAGTLLGLDFDGTLSPIVSDPAAAHIHPGSFAALQRLGKVLGRIAIITGRPIDQARALGGFDGASGLEHLVICGQYGAERWDAATGEVSRPPMPASVVELERRIPAFLAAHDASDVLVEKKGLAVALHTRALDDAAIDDLAVPLAALAGELGLACEPGRQVIELRAPGSDKGQALKQMVAETGARQVVYAGDDLGDLPAFDAVDELRAQQGITGFLVCSASEEQDALEPRSDVVVHGTDAVAGWLTSLADALD